MPYRIEFVGNGVESHFYGHVTLEDLREAAHYQWSRPEWDNTRYELADFSEADYFEIDPVFLSAVSKFGDAATRYSKRSKVALIAGNDQVTKMLELYVESSQNAMFEVQLFPDRQAAEVWLADVAKS